jgi:hypothetical protein
MSSSDTKSNWVGRRATWYGISVVVASRPRYVAGGYLVEVCREADDPQKRMPDGSIHPCHRAGHRFEVSTCALEVQ